MHGYFRHSINDNRPGNETKEWDSFSDEDKIKICEETTCVHNYKPTYRIVPVCSFYLLIHVLIYLLIYALIFVYICVDSVHSCVNVLTCGSILSQNNEGRFPTADHLFGCHSKPPWFRLFLKTGADFIYLMDWNLNNSLTGLYLKGTYYAFRLLWPINVVIMIDSHV
jgi:hypothetical protein